jgi:hypothetical protein
VIHDTQLLPQKLAKGTPRLRYVSGFCVFSFFIYFRSDDLNNYILGHFFFFSPSMKFCLSIYVAEQLCSLLNVSLAVHSFESSEGPRQRHKKYPLGIVDER